MTVIEFFPDYDSFENRNLSNKTWLTRTSFIRCHLIPVCGNAELSRITTDVINSIFNQMQKEEYAQNSIYGCYAAFRSFFKLAKTYGYIETNPVESAVRIYPQL